MDFKPERILIKYGGNAMGNPAVQQEIITEIAALSLQGIEIILVHGGGPEIARLLKLAGVESQFFEGHRRTDEQTMHYVEMALKGNVNSALVGMLNSAGIKAVGLTGKDAAMVRSVRRMYHPVDGLGRELEIDLGFVGDVDHIETTLPELLLGNGYLPVIAPLGWSVEENHTHNINADIFAGELAAALKADYLFLLTDTEGLLLDRHRPDSLVREISVAEIRGLPDGVIAEGMIPKTEAAIMAIEKGVGSCFILSGTRSGLISAVLSGENSGTQVLS